MTDYFKFAADNARREFQVQPMCEICHEPAGEGNALCPACAKNAEPDPAYVAYLKGEQPDPRD